MVSLEDLDESYITGSYIADSADVEATLEVIDIKDGMIDRDTDIYVYFSVGSVLYKIVVKGDYISDNDDSILTFLEEVELRSELPDIDSVDSFSIFDFLEGHSVTMTVDESLDEVSFSNSGVSYSIQEEVSNSEISRDLDLVGVDAYEHDLVLWNRYSQKRDSETGLKVQITDIKPNKNSFDVKVEGIDNLEWTLEIPSTRDRDTSAVVDFIEEVGKPSLLEGEYVTIVHESDVEYETNVLSEEDEWCIMKPEVYSTVMHSNTSKVYGNVSKYDRSVEQSSSSDSPASLFLVLVMLFGVCLAAIGFSGPPAESSSIQEVENPAIVDQPEEPDSSSNLQYSEDKDLSYSVDVDHEYPDGRFSLILSDNPEEILVQASSTQYEFNDRTLIHLYPEGSDAKYTYNPSETVTIIARDSQGGQNTIFYDTSNKFG